MGMENIAREKKKEKAYLTAGKIGTSGRSRDSGHIWFYGYCEDERERL